MLSEIRPENVYLRLILGFAMKGIDRNGRVGLSSLVISNVLWGIMAPVSKFVLAAGVISSAVLTDMRIFVGTMLFWLASLFFRKEKIECRGDYFKLFLAAFFSTTLLQFCYVKGISLTSPVDAAICTSTLPIWTLLLSSIFMGEKINSRKIAGIATGLAGAVALVLSGENNNLNGANIAGSILCLCSQISYAVYLVFFQDIIKKYSSVTLMKWKYLFSALMLLPFAFGHFSFMDFRAMDTAHWTGLAYILIFGNFIAYLLIPLAQKYLPPTNVAVYSYLQPATAVLVTLLWGLDSFNMLKVIAMAMIVISVFVLGTGKQTDVSVQK